MCVVYVCVLWAYGPILWHFWLGFYIQTSLVSHTWWRTLKILFPFWNANLRLGMWLASKKLSCLSLYFLWIHHNVVILFLMVGLTLIEEERSEAAYQQCWRGSPVQGSGHAVPNKQIPQTSWNLMAASILKLGVTLHMRDQLIISEWPEEKLTLIFLSVALNCFRRTALAFNWGGLWRKCLILLRRGWNWSYRIGEQIFNHLQKWFHLSIYLT